MSIFRNFEVLYKKDSKGNIRAWKLRVEGDEFTAEIQTETYTVNVPNHKKNIKPVLPNKANKAYPRAILLAETQHLKKLRLGYFMTIEEAKTKEAPKVCMLVKDMLPAEIQKMEFDDFPIFTELKLNGIRGTYHHDKGQILSRELKEFTKIPEIVKHCKDLCTKADINILDFEIYADGYKINDVVSMVKGDHPDKDKLRPWVFDMPEEGLSFVSRDANIQEMRRVHDPVGIKFVPRNLANNKEDVQAFYDLVINAGAEGIILRKLDGEYAWNNKTTRSNIIRKVKPVLSEEFKISTIYHETRVVKGEEIKLISFMCSTTSGQEFKVSPTSWGVEKRVELYKDWIDSKFTISSLPLLTIEFREYTKTGKPFHILDTVLRGYE